MAAWKRAASPFDGLRCWATTSSMNWNHGVGRVDWAGQGVGRAAVLQSAESFEAHRRSDRGHCQMNGRCCSVISLGLVPSPSPGTCIACLHACLGARHNFRSNEARPSASASDPRIGRPPLGRHVGIVLQSHAPLTSALELVIVVTGELGDRDASRSKDSFVVGLTHLALINDNK